MSSVKSFLQPGLTKIIFSLIFLAMPFLYRYGGYALAFLDDVLEILFAPPAAVLRLLGLVPGSGFEWPLGLLVFAVYSYLLACLFVELIRYLEQSFGVYGPGTRAAAMVFVVLPPTLAFLRGLSGGRIENYFVFHALIAIPCMLMAFVVATVLQEDSSGASSLSSRLEKLLRLKTFWALLPGVLVLVPWVMANAADTTLGGSALMSIALFVLTLPANAFRFLSSMVFHYGNDSGMIGLIFSALYWGWWIAFFCLIGKIPRRQLVLMALVTTLLLLLSMGGCLTPVPRFSFFS